MITYSDPWLTSGAHDTSTTKKTWKLQWRSSLIQRTRTDINMVLNKEQGKKVASYCAIWWSLISILGCICYDLNNKANKLPKYCKTFDLVLVFSNIWATEQGIVLSPLVLTSQPIKSQPESKQLTFCVWFFFLWWESLDSSSSNSASKFKISSSWRRRLLFRFNDISNIVGYLMPNSVYIYIYIYIFTKSTTIHGDKKKKKNPPEFRDNNILITAWGKKKKFIGRKKEKANFITPVEKNQEICNQLVKRTKTHHKMLQCYNYKKCSILNKAIYKNQIAIQDYPTTVSPKTAPQGIYIYIHII